MFDANRDRSILATLVKNATDAEAIVAGLHKNQISHLLIRHDFFQEWGREQFINEKLILLNSFFKKYTTLLFFERGYAVISLPPRH
ncbi:hypothetical protein [Desulfonema ishimotonii]|uniref:hypothetical protein n=1 Tax=Desulfonema ishimotonii TaxID=45657 RepID=UPI000F57ADDC|nr:hypothetical protein [Desulfonema ishimotonii]